LRKTWPYWGLLVVCLGVIWLIWPASSLESGPARTSAEEPAVQKSGLQKPKAPADDRDASDDFWTPFERIFLLAAVASNYLLLVVVAWSYWRAGGLKVAAMLLQQLQVIVAHLAAIEGALRTGSPKPTAPPALATPNPAPRMKNYETPPEQPALRPNPKLAPEPVRQAPVVQEPPSPPARREPIDESRRSPESEAWNLVRHYCLERGSSIVDLGQHAKEIGLQIGSPSFIRGQRHILDGPDHDSRLLAIKDRRDEKLFVVVGADAPVAESECLDLFEMPGFPGYCLVRSKRPATIDARTGEVEEKGELEVLGSP